MNNKLLKILDLFIDSSPIERKIRKKPFVILSKLSFYLFFVILFFIIIRVLNSFGWLFLPIGLMSLIDGFEKYFNKEKKSDILFEFGKAFCLFFFFFEKFTV